MGGEHRCRDQERHDDPRATDVVVLADHEQVQSRPSDLEDHRQNQDVYKRQVLTTGGSGRLHLAGFPTSNHYGATADGLVLAYRLGARLRDVDSFQYHPTGIAWPAPLEGQLISEAARSSGAFLVNGLGQRFVDELQPRDIVASAILREIAEGRAVVRDHAVGVFLDTPSLERAKPGVLARELVTLRHLARRAGFDPAEEPFLIRPTLHLSLIHISR